ncbi:hypothetical protein [Rickettsia sp. TH2014]|uniref:hypothetical protein n=1 Tax=Rickettsia sp. TH2014 TaxID=1967503 RepID=UPI001C46BD68|nr:hypothetical protein [Rickettsia sp. TH2014]
MPLISEIEKNKIKSPFKKRAYRPWDDTPNTELSNHNNTDSINKKSKSTALKKNDSLMSFSEEGLKKEFRQMFGAQKVIMQFLVNNIEDKDSEYAITKSITIDEFSSACQLPSNTIKSTLLKLKNKHFFVTHENKPGRGGYARYKFLLDTVNFFSKSFTQNKK